jgi:dihydroorotate dehydrogenase
MFMSVKTHIIHFLYTRVLKPVFFQFDPEDIHNFFISLGKFLGKHTLMQFCTKKLFDYSSPELEQNILGIHFKNPVGLAAGFDKNAELTHILPAVGFGFLEVGSITGEPCVGNPRPRLWRLLKHQSLLVNYGLKNDGCEVISKRMKNEKFTVPIGISIAKTNSPEFCSIELGIADYIKVYHAFLDIGDYNTINISCPNAYGGLPFTDPARLDLLLSEIQKISCTKPVFLKIPADSKDSEIDAFIELAEKYKIHGFICTNLLKNRTEINDKTIPKTGGISGKLMQTQSDHSISYIFKKTQGKFIIIGVGGISSGEDAYKKIRLGASLVQFITGMIYEGPQVIGAINEKMVQLIKQDGFKNISEAIGIDSKKI